MPFLRDVRNSLIIAHEQGLLSDEELLLLLEENSSKIPEFSYEKYARFSIERIEEPECMSEFRVEKGDFHSWLMRFDNRTPSTAIREPLPTSRRGYVFCSGECRFHADIATCLHDSADRFPNLAWYQIRWWIIFTIYTNYVSGIMTYWIQVTSTLTRMAYRIKRLHYKIVKGFIDGTIRPICRPSQEQRIMFNGHKRVHSLKFQSVTLPNGLIANLFAPVGY